MKKVKRISVSYNKQDIPIINVRENAQLTFKEDNKNTIQIIGNSIGLKLLAKALLGIADSERKDGFHIHINKENRNFTIYKKDAIIDNN